MHTTETDLTQKLHQIREQAYTPQGMVSELTALVTALGRSYPGNTLVVRDHNQEIIHSARYSSRKKTDTNANGQIDKSDTLVKADPDLRNIFNLALALSNLNSADEIGSGVVFQELADHLAGTKTIAEKLFKSLSSYEKQRLGDKSSSVLVKMMTEEEFIDEIITNVIEPRIQQIIQIIQATEFPELVYITINDIKTRDIEALARAIAEIAKNTFPY